MPCDAAFALRMPVLVVENDVSFPDDLTWSMESLPTASDPVVRGPFTLDDTFFSSAYDDALLDVAWADDADNSSVSSASWSLDMHVGNASGFWNARMPDVVFRIKGAGNGTFVGLEIGMPVGLIETVGAGTGALVGLPGTTVGEGIGTAVGEGMGMAVFPHSSPFHLALSQASLPCGASWLSARMAAASFRMPSASASALSRRASTEPATST